MAKPATKVELIQSAQAERTALDQYLENLSPEQMIQTNVLGDWSAKDVLAHLTEWEQMVLQWYWAGLQGLTPTVPSADFNWGKLPQLNQAIYHKYRDVPLHAIQKKSAASFAEIMQVIESIPESDLFTRKIYPWTNNNLLAAYFVSVTSSHYRWARTELRKGFKNRQQESEKEE